MITCIMSRHLMTHHHTRLLLWSLTAVGINEHLRCLLDVMSSVYHLLYVRVAPVLPSSSSLPLPSHCPPSALTRETQKKTPNRVLRHHTTSPIFHFCLFFPPHVCQIQTPTSRRCSSNTPTCREAAMEHFAPFQLSQRDFHEMPRALSLRLGRVDDTSNGIEHVSWFQFRWRRCVGILRRSCGRSARLRPSLRRISGERWRR